MANWFRSILAIILSVVFGGVWGLFAFYFGAPSFVVTLGVVLIPIVIFTYLFGDKR